jgi:type II secretory pathway pseudopilin PulG
MKKLIFNEKGLTLIEILVSIILLTTVFFTFMAFFTNAFNYNVINSDSIQGMNIAREYQAKIKESTYGIDKLLGEPSDPSTAIASLHLTAGTTQNGAPYIPIIDNQYNLEINDPKYNIKIKIKINTTPEAINGSYRKLYLVYVTVSDKKNKLLSETYTYYELKEGV